MNRRPPRFPLFPYATLVRSAKARRELLRHDGGDDEGDGLDRLGRVAQGVELLVGGRALRGLPHHRVAHSAGYLPGPREVEGEAVAGGGFELVWSMRRASCRG